MEVTYRIENINIGAFTLVVGLGIGISKLVRTMEANRQLGCYITSLVILLTQSHEVKAGCC